MSVLKDKMNKRYLGVDIGGTSIYLVLMNDRKEILGEKKVNSSNSLQRIVNIIYSFLYSFQTKVEDISFISFGVPGTTNFEEGIVLDAPALQWRNLPFREKMKEYFNCPIFVDNDVNCAAMGEKWLGVAQGTDDFVYISIGTGVGSAIFLNGNLVRGYTYEAGEIGYVILSEDIESDLMNSSGEFGMLESKISGSALARTGQNPILLFEEYYKGTNDLEVQKTITTFKELLSITIANLASLLNPEKVIISGGVALSLKGLITDVNELVEKYTPIETDVILSSLGDASGAIGAVALGLNQIEVLEVM